MNTTVNTQTNQNNTKSLPNLLESGDYLENDTDLWRYFQSLGNTSHGYLDFKDKKINESHKT